MTVDWCQGIREACDYWGDRAPLLQHTFQALEADLLAQSDATIDASKGLVECVCQIIIKELDDPASPIKPASDAPITTWLAAATRLLGLSDIHDRPFADLVKHHNKLAESLRILRNDAGPVSHGKLGFAQTLTAYHHRSAVLMADAIVTFLHESFLEARVDLKRTNEPYARFHRFNELIDEHVAISTSLEDDGSLTLTALLPTGDQLVLTPEPSRLLYQLDRDAYIEALNAARLAADGVPMEDAV